MKIISDVNQLYCGTLEKINAVKCCKPLKSQNSEAWGRGFESHAARQKNQRVTVHAVALFCVCCAKSVLIDIEALSTLTALVK